MILATVIDPTISVGNLLTMMTTLGAAGFALWRFSVVVARIEAQVEMKLEMLWKDYCQRHGMNGGGGQTDSDYMREFFKRAMKKALSEKDTTEA